MKKAIKLLACAAFLSLLAMPAHAVTLPEHAEGKTNAPVTIIEYASLTCSHCADFYTQTIPEIQKRFIDTGKVRFIYRDFPLDGIALKASALAECMPADRYFSFIKILFSNQANWARSTKFEAVLIQYAAMAGLDAEKAKACIGDADVLDALVAQRNAATDKHDIQSTPTFIFNDGADKLIGAQSVDEFAKIIDKLSAKKK